MDNLYWRGVRSFLLVAEAGSFTKAADNSGISKANLSQQVTELEKHLSVQLLFRTTRKLRLTEVGAEYYQQCKQAVEQLELAAEAAVENTQALKGAIKINCVGGVIGEQLVAPLLIEFQKQNPEIQIELDFSSRQEDLLTSSFDLVVRMGELEDSSLIARKLHTITTCYAASPEFLSGYPEIKKPEDIKHMPWVYGSVAEWKFTYRGKTQILTPESGFKAANGQAMLQAALAGLGITRMGDVYLQSYFDSGELVEVLPKWRQVTPLSLVCPPLKYQKLRVKKLMDYLLEEFEKTK